MLKQPIKKLKGAFLRGQLELASANHGGNKGDQMMKWFNIWIGWLKFARVKGNKKKTAKLSW